ncbi:MAG: serine O-acetyltransferase [Corynebacteriales bacterium]|nr:serine O-acetyltransferase [Mycobacteriales bacterium]
MNVGAVLAAALADLDVIVERDPSVDSRVDALLHPALPALWTHRIAHGFYVGRRRRIAKALSNCARLVSGGVEIHPGATLGRRVFIDHGAAVVIGETAEIGDDVTLFHQVTLGAVGWWRDDTRPPDARRHPVVGSGAVIGAGATVLGPVVIGDNALVGATSLVLTDVPAGGRTTPPVATITAAGPRPRTTDTLQLVASTGCW